jgi:uncharacterized protein
MKNTAYRFLNHVCALLFGWALLFNASFAQAQSVLPIPPLTALVMDQTNTLTASEVAQLDAKLKTFEKTKGSQIGILIVPTTAPEDVFSYAQRAAETYKLGRKGVGDGVLIVIAKNDRKVHVYVMRALEGAIPDAYAKRIINEQMQPAFRQNQFAAGLDAATTQIEKLINGEQLPTTAEWQAQQKEQNSGGDIWTSLLILTLAASFIGSGIAKSTSRWLVAPLAAAGAGFVALDMSSLLAAAGVVALIVGLAVMIFGKRYAQLATQHGNSPFSRTTTSRRNNDIFWGGGFGGGGFGGFGGGSGGGGGWGGSGGGGDAGGGGASGGW